MNNMSNFEISDSIFSLASKITHDFNADELRQIINYAQSSKAVTLKDKLTDAASMFEGSKGATRGDEAWISMCLALANLA